jgi:glycerol-3-phosphate dehydrogenase
MDDARINVALATTAALAGAAVANHVRVVSLTKARHKGATLPQRAVLARRLTHHAHPRGM